MKIIAALLLIFTPCFSQAKDGFFAEAGGSLGTTAITYTQLPYTIGALPWAGPISMKPTLGFDAGVGIGYRLCHWEFETGVRYLQTGYVEKYEFGEIEAEYTSVKTTYSHIAVPVKVDYCFMVGKKFSISPGVEFICTDNLSDRSTDKDKYIRVNTVGNFNSVYKTISGWGGALVHASYQAGPKLSVFAGPEAAYMLGDFTTGSLDMVHQRNYFYQFNFGIRYSFQGI